MLSSLRGAIHRHPPPIPKERAGDAAGRPGAASARWAAGLGRYLPTARTWVRRIGLRSMRTWCSPSGKGNTSPDGKQCSRSGVPRPERRSGSVAAPCGAPGWWSTVLAHGDQRSCLAAKARHRCDAKDTHPAGRMQGMKPSYWVSRRSGGPTRKTWRPEGG